MSFNSIAFFESHYSAPLCDGAIFELVAWMLKTPENIGGLMRLAANIGAKRVWLVESDSYEVSEMKVRRVARSAFETVEFKLVKEHDVMECLDQHLLKVALETSPGSVDIFEEPLPLAMALFLGNEKDGLPQWVVNACDVKVFVPMPGSIKSMNVAQAATVAAFEWYRQNRQRG